MHKVKILNLTVETREVPHTEQSITYSEPLSEGYSEALYAKTKVVHMPIERWVMSYADTPDLMINKPLLGELFEEEDIMSGRKYIREEMLVSMTPEADRFINLMHMDNRKLKSRIYQLEAQLDIKNQALTTANKKVKNLEDFKKLPLYKQVWKLLTERN